MKKNAGPNCAAETEWIEEDRLRPVLFFFAKVGPDKFIGLRSEVFGLQQKTAARHSSLCAHFIYHQVFDMIRAVNDYRKLVLT
ncbi:hypothetical protein [Sporolactobacillus vineae]|uniref:hypothetical protein n=1 Tax=Sporolactobacillus vineae TaxID=444463 RepID=UPI0003805DA3|nr:hypothetical protein [Sporolactobacillus vineae]